MNQLAGDQDGGQGHAGDDVARDPLYRKVVLRVMPLLLACYIVSFIDRTNIGIAQEGLSRDLGFGPAVYGFAITLFFIGFILFEVPSNALLDRIGARKTLVRIMLLWGLVTIGTLFVTNAGTFYLARFLLGVVEAGFFPGALFYLAQWFPSARRTRMTGLFFIGVPAAGVLGSLSSGAIMHAFGGVGGLADWQWLFLIEGIPPLVLAVIVYYCLADKPEKAGWLRPAERKAIRSDLDEDERLKSARGDGIADTRGGLRAALRDPKVWTLGVCACGAYTLANAVTFWTPRIISASGVQNVLNLGVFSAIPPLVGICVMLLVGRSSDRRLERRWHAGLSWLVAALGLVLLPVAGDSVVAIVVLLTVITSAHYSGLTVFYSIPSIYLSGRSAATGIAMVTSMGSVAAALAPSMLGFIEKRTDSIALGLQISAGLIVAASLVLLLAINARELRERHV